MARFVSSNYAELPTVSEPGSISNPQAFIPAEDDQPARTVVYLHPTVEAMEPAAGGCTIELIMENPDLGRWKEVPPHD